MLDLDAPQPCPTCGFDGPRALREIRKVVFYRCPGCRKNVVWVYTPRQQLSVTRLGRRILAELEELRAEVSRLRALPSGRD